jgi:hypothetical protein
MNVSSSQDQPIKHPLKTLQFYLMVVLSGAIGGPLMYFGFLRMTEDMYLTEPPQYPVRSLLFGTVDQWPAFLRDNAPLGNTTLDVVVLCFFLSLAMTSIHLAGYYAPRKFGRAALSGMLLWVGAFGSVGVMAGASQTGTGWYAGLELGVLAAIAFMLIPTLIGLMVIGLKKALPVCWRGALSFARRTRRSYGEHRTVHKKNEVV